MDEIQTFGQIDEEILSKELPKSWGKIEIGSYSYQLSRGVGADHFSLKSKETILAFVDEAKRRKNVQLSVYQEKTTKRKAITYGSSVVDTNNSTVSIHIYYCICITLILLITFMYNYILDI